MVLLKGFALSAVVAVAAAKSAVIDLRSSNFDDVVLKSGKATFVEFYAPWCGHCKNLAPIWEDLGVAYEHAKNKVQIAKVNGDEDRALSKRFGIQGFPTLKFFDGKSDTPLDYEEARDLQSLSNFIRKQVGIEGKKKVEVPSNVVMLNERSFPKAIGGDQNILVAFTAPWCGHCKTLAPIWEDIANSFASEDNVMVAKVDADAADGKLVGKEYGITGYPTLKYFRAGSKKAEPYEGGRTEADFVEFMNGIAGTQRMPGGELNSQAGTVASLDTLVSKMLGDGKMTDITAELEKESEKLTKAAQKKYAEYYVRVVNKLSKSEAFAEKELTRLTGILSKGGIAPLKRDEIQRKLNVLRKFTEGVGDKVTESVGEKVTESVGDQATKEEAKDEL
ncbi:putative protein disulfide-isomerase precursor [Drechmeria coniospora]|uniref:protein disulfide-isomerase n=1 Tax=Drechmeria coniospora TaxID=98403 RepID=A0A151GNI0_DRECN|nr:putative protein disulfide-isomerase precursor [Drechmeria coniospora]KYK58677.1 putative protein disulfide-isomerase precursor [Drechmeria coniospora]